MSCLKERIDHQQRERERERRERERERESRWCSLLTHIKAPALRSLSIIPSAFMRFNLLFIWSTTGRAQVRCLGLCCGGMVIVSGGRYSRVSQCTECWHTVHTSIHQYWRTADTHPLLFLFITVVYIADLPWLVKLKVVSI